MNGGTLCYSQISYCYNAKPRGNLSSSTDLSGYYQCNGIVGEHGSKTLASELTPNYYNISGWDASKINSANYNAGFIPYNSNNLKKQLYNWANSGPMVSGKYIYNTIAPLDTSKGFDGFGVLYWEKDGSGKKIGEDYAKIELNMVLCNRSEGSADLFSNFTTNTYDQSIWIGGGQINLATLQKNIGCCKKTTSVNLPFGTSPNGCYNYIIMIPKNKNATVKATTSVSSDAKSIFYRNGVNKGENVSFTKVNLSSNCKLHFAYILDIQKATIIANKWEWVFKRKNNVLVEDWYFEKKGTQYNKGWYKYKPEYDGALNDDGERSMGEWIGIGEKGPAAINAMEAGTIWHKFGLIWDDYYFDKDQHLVWSAGINYGVYEKNVVGEGDAYINFGDLSSYLGTEASDLNLYSATLSIKGRMSRVMNGTGAITKVWNDLFGDEGTVPIECELQKYNSITGKWEKITNFDGYEFAPTNNAFNEDTNEEITNAKSFTYRTNKRYRMEFELDSKRLDENITSVRSNQQIRLKIHVKNNDNKWIKFYIDSASMDITYGLNAQL